jgi:hypothetical protein
MMTKTLMGLVVTMLVVTGCHREQEEAATGVSLATSSHSTTNDRSDAVRIARFGFVQLWPDVAPPH